jgi:FkbM family methyltransferase
MNYHLTQLSERSGPQLPPKHIQYLQSLKAGGFEPNVIYDIGSCVLHWTHEAQKIWPQAKIILFDAFARVQFLYKGYEYFIGLLGDTDGKIVKFYNNDQLPGGNSYYRETFMDGRFFPSDAYAEMIMHRLDTVVDNMGFPYPDFVKIDVQGSEQDVIRGGERILSHASRMIVEMQHVQYNDGAPLVADVLPYIESIGWKCDANRFCEAEHDADYGFVRVMA